MTEMENIDNEEKTKDNPLFKEPLCLRISLDPTLQDELPSGGPHSTILLTKRERNFTLDKYPQTGLDLKLALQDEFQIPVSLQKLTLQRHLELTNDQSMKQIHLRQGDVITVHYTTQGNVKELQHIIDTLKELSIKLQELSERINDGGYSLSLHELLVFNRPEIQHISDHYFKHTNPSTSRVNHIYFMNNSGVDATVRLLELVTDISWGKLPLPLQFIEQWCIRIIWNMSSTVGVRRFLLNYSNIIEILGKSILRVSFNEDKKPIGVVNDCWNNRTIPPYILTESLLKTVFKGIGVIANLAELEEYRLPIVEMPGLISQMTTAMLCPHYKVFLTHLTLSTLVCLSYSPSTHTALTQCDILTRIMNAAELCNNSSDDTMTMMDIKERDVIIINYFVTVFFGLVNTCLLSNPDNHKLLPEIVSVMKQFFVNTTHTQVRQAEIDMGYFGTTIKPYVQLCYSSSFSLSFPSSTYHASSLPLSISVLPSVSPSASPPTSSSHTLSSIFSSLFSFSSLRSKSTPSITLPSPSPSLSPPPPPPQLSPLIINDLKLASFRIGIFSILNMSLTDTFEDIVAKETLQDYLTCFPWYVKEELRDEARKVTHAVNEKMNPTPPKLVNILKARFAIEYDFNLDQVMSQHFVNETLSKY